MAEGFYNAMTQSKEASSAGTDPKTPLKYPQLPESIRRIMREEGVDVSGQRVKLITKEIVDSVERIIVLCKRERCPDFLLHSPKAIFWNIDDPYQMNIEDMRLIRDEIKMKAAALLSCSPWRAIE